MRPSLLPIALLAIPLVGCGEAPPELATVKGRVTLDGKPLDAGTIRFAPTGETKGAAATAQIAPNGEFELVNTGGAAGNEVGAIVGTHLVCITDAATVLTEETMSPDYVPPESKIPPRYKDFATSGLKATVVSGPNEIDFELVTAEQ